MWGCFKNGKVKKGMKFEEEEITRQKLKRDLFQIQKLSSFGSVILTPHELSSYVKISKVKALHLF